MSDLDLQEATCNLSNNHQVKNPTTCFNFKGNSYTLTTFQILTNDLEAISNELRTRLKTTFNFFYKAPVIIDLKQLNENNLNINIVKLKEILIINDLLPVAISNASTEQQLQALDCNLAILRSAVGDKLIKITKNNKLDSDNYEKTAYSNQNIMAHEYKKIITSSSTLITENIRCGQQVYAKGGDLIVAASVERGAELLADGNIHIYGKLEGKALAGVNGDNNARIFCKNLKAELVSIAGKYMLTDDIKKFSWNVATQIFIYKAELTFLIME